MFHRNFIPATLFIGIVLGACNAPRPKNEQVNFKPNLQGAWEVISTISYEKGIPQDTFFVSPNARMVKLFTQKKYMWTNQPKDSIEWHAFGSYEIVGDTLVENKEYCSKSMAGHSSQSKALVEITPESFSQTLLDPKGEAFYRENYKRIDD